MGPSGSGKSTLMHCLAGLDDAQRWRGLHRRHRPHRRSTTSALTRLRRDAVGFIFQAFNLLPTLTALENITLPMDIAGRKPDKEWLDTVIDTVGLRDRLDAPADRAVRRPAAARRRAPARWRADPRSSSPTSPPATSTRASGAEVLGFLRGSVTRAGPDHRDGHPRPDRRVVRRPGRCSSPTAASSTRCADPTAESVLDRMKQFEALHHAEIPQAHRPGAHRTNPSVRRTMPDDPCHLPQPQRASFGSCCRRCRSCSACRSSPAHSS